MTHREPVTEAMADQAAAAPWERVREPLAGADTYWLATVGPDHRPHVVPVLAVWVDEALHFCASDGSRKVRNLGRDPHCVITTCAREVDLVVHGQASPVREATVVERAAAAYGTKYGWHPEVRDGVLWEEGAPTAGPPPYRVYRMDPALAFGFPTGGDDPVTPTRYRF